MKDRELSNFSIFPTTRMLTVLIPYVWEFISAIVTVAEVMIIILPWSK